MPPGHGPPAMDPTPLPKVCVFNILHPKFGFRSAGPLRIPKRAHLRVPAFNHTTKKSTKRPPTEQERMKIEGKKARNFGPPTLRAPTFSIFWACTLRASTLRGPTVWGPTLRAFTLRGTLWTPPKFNIQKLAEVEIGRSRIGRSKKKKRSWPKSIALDADFVQADFGQNWCFSLLGAPKGGMSKGGASKGGGAQNFARSPTSIFVLFQSLSLGVFSWNFGGV